MNTISKHMLACAATVMVLAGCTKSPDATPAPMPVTTAPPIPSTSSTAPSTASSTPTATGNVADVDVTENVTTALLRNELLKGAQITVITTKGDVRLVGVLTSQAQIDAALATARTTDGVHALHNELTLKP